DLTFPAETRYDLVWVQWVIGHLRDAHLVDFLRRAAASLSPCGMIGVKDNVITARDDSEYDFDEQDSSVCRPRRSLLNLFNQAGLIVLLEETQEGFPDALYPVLSFALVPKGRLRLHCLSSDRLLVTFLDSDEGRRRLLEASPIRPATVEGFCKKLRCASCGMASISLVMRCADWGSDSSDIKPLSDLDQRGMTADDVAACLLRLGAAASAASWQRRRAPRSGSDSPGSRVIVYHCQFHLKSLGFPSEWVTCPLWQPTIATQTVGRQKSESARRLLHWSFSLGSGATLPFGGKGGGGSGRRAVQEVASGCSCARAVLQVLNCWLVVATFPFSLLLCLKVVAQYDAGRPAGPGMIFPAARHRLHEGWWNLRTMTFDVPTQGAVAVEAVVYYRYLRPGHVGCQRRGLQAAPRKLLAQDNTAQRPLARGQSLTSCWPAPAGRIHLLMQETLDAATDTWGVKVERV
uniref:Alpha N-terminal protein methyltransferase 1 n=1 Tax=Macrostomum lignano TaxID=282301 RepID=A0A1I8F7R9_9PLAT